MEGVQQVLTIWCHPSLSQPQRIHL